MKTKPIPPAKRAALSFDGKGINGPDQYRTRIATFTTDEDAKKYGKLFEAAPELLLRLKELLELADRCIGRRGWSQLDQAEAAIAKAEAQQ